ncbi:L,D-transpeptidase family protein [Novosphingobium sp.]|uniref:L,D-transpeptidase family protein n=1 Tax=Novosphingobium sp. TaxID=1874826 RepID=UPI0025E3FF8F|nr:L,D-transpeptidase family protein [Novosphingobium sp.]
MVRRLAAVAALTMPLAGMAILARAQEPAPPLPQIDRIVVDKSERRMELYADGALVHIIHGIQLGDEPIGAKQFQGDERTPEGRFTIDYGNPNSAYHLSLHIDYPRIADTAFARSKGRNPGGQIFIHGQPNSLPAGRIPGDWTDGCIAVSNDEIEALWQAVADGTPIDINA